MRIAFVGKGGSGKTTVSSLFSLYMDSTGKRIGMLDVDVNSHTAEVIGASPKVPHLSDSTAEASISKFLVGTNPRVKSHELLNTTPPGTGSGRWTLDDANHITANYTARFGQRSRVATLGSYTDKSIGADCHHTTQHIAENILTHAQLTDNDILVIDSVAGNDTFANSLYIQDVLLFVIKPEREGLNVFERYTDMARRAGVGDRVFAVGNNVSSDAQRQFLEKNISANRLLGCLPISDVIIERRLEDLPIDSSCVTSEYARVFDGIYRVAKQLMRTPAEYHDEIVALHRKVAEQSWVAGAYRAGLVDQIELTYDAV